MTTLAKLERRVQALEDVQAITQLKHRYFRLLDHQDWHALRECFTEDIETHYESGHYRFAGGSWAAPDIDMQVGDEADSRARNADARAS